MAGIRPVLPSFFTREERVVRRPKVSLPTREGLEHPERREPSFFVCMLLPFFPPANGRRPDLGPMIFAPGSFPESGKIRGSRIHERKVRKNLLTKEK